MGCKRCERLTPKVCCFCFREEGPGVILITGIYVAICDNCVTNAFRSVVDYDDRRPLGDELEED